MDSKLDSNATYYSEAEEIMKGSRSVPVRRSIRLSQKSKVVYKDFGLIYNIDRGHTNRELSKNSISERTKYNQDILRPPELGDERMITSYRQEQHSRPISKKDVHLDFSAKSKELIRETSLAKIEDLKHIHMNKCPEVAKAKETHAIKRGRPTKAPSTNSKSVENSFRETTRKADEAALNDSAEKKSYSLLLAQRFPYAKNKRGGLKAITTSRSCNPISFQGGVGDKPSKTPQNCLTTGNKTERISNNRSEQRKESLNKCLGAETKNKTFDSKKSNELAKTFIGKKIMYCSDKNISKIEIGSKNLQLEPLKSKKSPVKSKFRALDICKQNSYKDLTKRSISDDLVPKIEDQTNNFPTGTFQADTSVPTAVGISYRNDSEFLGFRARTATSAILPIISQVQQQSDIKQTVQSSQQKLISLKTKRGPRANIPKIQIKAEIVPEIEIQTNKLKTEFNEIKNPIKESNVCDKNLNDKTLISRKRIVPDIEIQTIKFRIESVETKNPSEIEQILHKNQTDQRPQKMSISRKRKRGSGTISRKRRCRTSTNISQIQITANDLQNVKSEPLTPLNINSEHFVGSSLKNKTATESLAESNSKSPMTQNIKELELVSNNFKNTKSFQMKSEINKSQDIFTMSFGDKMLGEILQNSILTESNRAKSLDINNGKPDIKSGKQLDNFLQNYKIAKENVDPLSKMLINESQRDLFNATNQDIAMNTTYISRGRRKTVEEQTQNVTTEMNINQPNLKTSNDLKTFTDIQRTSNSIDTNKRCIYSGRRKTSEEHIQDVLKTFEVTKTLPDAQRNSNSIDSNSRYILRGRRKTSKEETANVEKYVNINQLTLQTFPDLQRTSIGTKINCISRGEEKSSEEQTQKVVTKDSYTNQETLKTSIESKPFANNQRNSNSVDICKKSLENFKSKDEPNTSTTSNQKPEPKNYMKYFDKTLFPEQIYNATKYLERLNSQNHIQVPPTPAESTPELFKKSILPDIYPPHFKHQLPPEAVHLHSLELQTPSTYLITPEDTKSFELPESSSSSPSLPASLCEHFQNKDIKDILDIPRFSYRLYDYHIQALALILNLQADYIHKVLERILKISPKVLRDIENVVKTPFVQDEDIFAATPDEWEGECLKVVFNSQSPKKRKMSTVLN